MKLKGRCFLQIVDRDSGALYPILVVLASEHVGGRSLDKAIDFFLSSSFRGKICTFNNGLRSNMV